MKVYVNLDIECSMPLYIYIYIYIWDSSNQQLAGQSPRTIYKSPVNGLAPFRVLVAQLVEHSSGVRKVVGSNPIGDSDFFPSLFMCVSTIPSKHKTTHIQQPVQYYYYCYVYL